MGFETNPKHAIQLHLTHVLQATCKTSQLGKHMAPLALSAPRLLTSWLMGEIGAFPILVGLDKEYPTLDGPDPESADMIQTCCLLLPVPLQPPKNSSRKMSVKARCLLSLCPKKAKELTKGRGSFLLTPNPGNAVSAAR